MENKNFYCIWSYIYQNILNMTKRLGLMLLYLPFSINAQSDFALAHLPELPDIQAQLIEQNFDGVAHHAFSVDTEEGYTYEIQRLDENHEWQRMISFEGFGVPFNYPVRAIDSSLNTSTPLEEIQSSVITVETGNFPGVVLSWHSLQSETGVAKYVENFNVTASWEAFPPQSLSIGDDLYLLIRGRSDRPETLNTIPLAQVDQDYIDAFIAEAPNLNPQIGGSSGISSTPAYHGEKLILRAKVVHSDFDGDGIADVVENTIPEGETEPYSDYQNPDTDGDEVGDGTELVSSTNPRVATSKPPSVAQSMTPTKDKIFGSSGNLVRDFGAEGQLAAEEQDAGAVILKAPKATG